MKILRDPKRLNPCVLVLGMFDGVHRGHQALLMRGGELAQEMNFPLSVLSFEPHPLRVLAPERAPLLLNTIPEKARIMQSFGVDNLCITTFDRQRADQSPEDFMAEMVATYAPVVVVCGFNYTFGKGGKVLMDIDRVSDNLALAAGVCGSSSGSVPTNVGQPCIRVKSLTVGGKGDIL